MTGIVAAVSKEIHACGCSFEDSTMTFLGDHFTLMILVSGEGEDTEERLARACVRLREEKGLGISLFPLGPREKEGSPTSPEPNYEIRVKGVDRIKIVYRTSQLLSARNINIVRMETSLDPAEGPGEPIFTMRSAVVIPKDVDTAALREDLGALAEDLSEMISLNRIPKN